MKEEGSTPWGGTRARRVSGRVAPELWAALLACALLLAACADLLPHDSTSDPVPLDAPPVALEEGIARLRDHFAAIGD